MKKIVIFLLPAVVAASTVRSQTIFGSISIQKNNGGATFHGDFDVTPSVGLFTGFNICPALQAPDNAYPFTEKASSYLGGYAGAFARIKTVSIGIGVETNQTRKKGDTMTEMNLTLQKTRLPFRLCPRLYTSGTFGKIDLMVSTNIHASLFDFFGYITASVSQNIALGVYANQSSIGYGPMVRFATSTTTDKPYAVALGYRNHQVGVAASLIMQ